MSKKALLIGINYFNTSNELSGCINDVNNVKNYLSTIGYNDFTMLIDSKDDPRHQYPNCPTKANIVKCIKSLVKSLRRGDSLFVGYSGHGSYTRDRNNEEKDGRDECICPVDDTTIIDDELIALFKGIALGAKLRVIFDSCFSGSALDLPFRFQDQMVVENFNYINRDIIMISGCRDDQTSADAYIENKYSGALTWAFLQTLDGFKQSLPNKRNWTWQDLVTIMRYKLRSNSYSQVPQISFAVKYHINRIVDII